MKQKQNEAYAKMENGKYAYHTVHSKGRAKGGERGHRNRRNWSELNCAEPGRTWSEVESKLPLTENRLAVLGWVYMVAPELLPGQSCLCLQRAYRFLSAQNAFDFDREREVKKKTKCKLATAARQKRGWPSHFGIAVVVVVVLEFWSCPRQLWLPLAEMTWPNKMASSFCVIVCVCGKSMSIIFMTLTCFVGQSDPSISSRGWSQSTYLLSASSSTSITSFCGGVGGCFTEYISVTVAPLYVRACVCPLNRKLLSIMRNMKATRRGEGGLGLYLYVGCSNWG